MGTDTGGLLLHLQEASPAMLLTALWRGDDTIPPPILQDQMAQSPTCELSPALL